MFRGICSVDDEFMTADWTLVDRTGPVELKPDLIPDAYTYSQQWDALEILVIVNFALYKKNSEFHSEASQQVLHWKKRLLMF